jgi:prepilin signal peptidase PulO-like enzyme (type II secretory pathway)
MTPFVVLVMAVLGAVVSYAATILASKRSQRQPVDQELAAEEIALYVLSLSPADVFKVVPALTSADFTNKELGERYQKFTERVLGVLSEYAPKSDPKNRKKKEVDAAIAAAKCAQDGALVDSLIKEYEYATGDIPKIDGKIKDPVLHYCGVVMSAGAYREQNTPRSPFVEKDGVLSRAYVAPSRLRIVLSILVGALGASLLTIAVRHIMIDQLALSVAYFAIVVTVFACVEISFVDFDTYYLDTPVFWPLVLLAWAATSLSQVLDHHPHRLLAGVVVAVFIALSFEGMSRLFSALRGHSQGAGDTMIIVLTAGIPAALTGSWRLGLYSLIAGCATAIIEWTIRHRHQSATGETPIAFGPHLALGWVIAAAVLLSVGLL